MRRLYTILDGDAPLWTIVVEWFVRFSVDRKSLCDKELLSLSKIKDDKKSYDLDS